MPKMQNEGKSFRNFLVKFMAAKAGGPDPSMNPALRLVVDKAKLQICLTTMWNGRLKGYECRR